MLWSQDFNIYYLLPGQPLDADTRKPLAVGNIIKLVDITDSWVALMGSEAAG